MTAFPLTSEDGAIQTEQVYAMSEKGNGSYNERALEPSSQPNTAAVGGPPHFSHFRELRNLAVLSIST